MCKIIIDFIIRLLLLLEAPSKAWCMQPATRVRWSNYHEKSQLFDRRDISHVKFNPNLLYTLIIGTENVKDCS